MQEVLEVQEAEVVDKIQVHLILEDQEHNRVNREIQELLVLEMVEAPDIIMVAIGLQAAEAEEQEVQEEMFHSQ
jgi:hypothetical protein